MATIIQLPLAIALSGLEYVPVDFPNGDGTYTTKRVQSGLMAGAGVAPIPLKTNVIASARTEMATITGASMNQFVSTYIGDANNADGSYDAYWLNPFAPLNGTLYGLFQRYFLALGQSSSQTTTHLTNIWNAAQAVANMTPLAPPVTKVLTAADLASVVVTLPTTMPTTVGALWNNGGVISVVQP